MDLMDIIKEAAESPCPKCDHPAGRHTQKRLERLPGWSRAGIILVAAVCADCGCTFFEDPDAPAPPEEE